MELQTSERSTGRYSSVFDVLRVEGLPPFSLTTSGARAMKARMLAKHASRWRELQVSDGGAA